MRSLPLRAWSTGADGTERRTSSTRRLGLPGQGYDWRDLTETVKALKRRGWTLHIYAREAAREYYEAIGAVYHGLVPYLQLMRELRQYRFGFVGLDIPHIKHATASPNKLTEYAAAGVIPAVCNAPKMSASVPCVSGTSIDELVDADESCDEVTNARRVSAGVEWMDDEIHELEGLYKGRGMRVVDREHGPEGELWAGIPARFVRRLQVTPTAP